MGRLFEFAQLLERERVLSAGHRLPLDRQTERVDACRVERFETRGGGWDYCATHDTVYRAAGQCPQMGC